MIRVGIVGFSGSTFDEEKARALIHREFITLAALHGTAVEIVSGYTHIGIPGIAYEEAVQFGFQTKGITTPKSKEFPCFPCDAVEIIGTNWGDESPFFLAYIDQLLKFGGGEQAIQEFANFTGEKMEFEL